jgi:hypothetical protein
MHCISLFVLFRLAILLSVLRFTVYPFGIFKLFLLRCIEHSGKLIHGGDRNAFEVMTLASLLVEALYQGNPNKYYVLFRNLYRSKNSAAAYPSGASEFTPGFMWDSCYSIFGCICMHCISLFVLFRLAILLSVLRFTVYPFGIFKLFLLRCIHTSRRRLLLFWYIIFFSDGYKYLIIT